MSCDCYVTSLLVEARSSVEGYGSGCGIAQSCAPLDDIAHPTYANSTITDTYHDGNVFVTDYSTDISGDAGSSCPAPSYSGSTGDYIVSTDGDVPVYLSDVRAFARTELVWHDWGTAPDFAAGATATAAGYTANWLTFQGGENVVKYQTLHSLQELFPVIEAYDIGGGGPASAQLTAAVKRYQVRFTLGPPKLPMRLKWKLIKVSDSSIIASDEVLLNSGAPTHIVDVAAASSSGVVTGDDGAAHFEAHLFACPYHL